MEKQNKDKVVQSIKEVDLSDIKVPAVAIYKHPSDYPDKYVARIFDADKPTNTIILKDTFAAVQQDIRRNTNMYFCPRGKEDDPCIVGVWI